jgi:colicin import membrane protein
MNTWSSYRIFFVGALALHILVAISVFWEHKDAAVAVNKDSGRAPLVELNQSVLPEEQPALQAHSVDEKALTTAVQQLKLERQQAALAEKKHQDALLAQAKAAQQQRLEEQRRVDELKAEAARLALAEKKRAALEQQRLTELAHKQQAEQQQLAALKEEQRQLREKIRHEEQVKAAAKIAAEKAAAEKAVAAKKAMAEKAASQARMAGVIDQYKARIIHAISQQWILPENTDNRLSSQFRIQLSPEGRVLQVSLIRSSGDAVLDRSAQSAIYKASPLPIPHDPQLFKMFRDISLTVRPENIQD